MILGILISNTHLIFWMINLKKAPIIFTKKKQNENMLEKTNTTSKFKILNLQTILITRRPKRLMRLPALC